MSLGKFSLREVRSRPSRVALTVLSIAIGVGAVVAVLLATTTSRQAQREMLAATSGKADLELVSDAPSGFSYDIVAIVRETAGVELAAPSINRVAVIFAGERKARAQVFGIDPRIDQQVRDYNVVSGRLSEKFDEILLDQSFAQSLEVSVGQSVKILARGGLQEYRVVGLVRPAGTAIALGSAAYLVLPAAQSAFKTAGQIDQIQVVVKPDADVATVEQQLSQSLPKGVTLRIPRTTSDMAQETLFATENGLRMAIAFAVLIAIFIIYNTFEMTVGERRRQLGILRAIGATRGQVMWMILRESLWLSVLGAIAGCFLGVWGAGLLNQVTEQIMRVTLPGATLTLLPFVVAVALGIAISLLGALAPARRASRVEPLEAMRAIEVHHNDELIRRATPLGFILFFLGLVLLWLTTSNWFPLGTDIAAVVAMLLGCVLLIPVLLTSVASGLARGLSWFLGVEAKLAQKQLTRHIGRTTLTVGVLFIAISTSAGMAGNVLDNVQNITNWYSRAIIADFFVRASMPDLATGAAADLPEETGEQLKEIEGIKSLDPMRFVNAQSGEQTVLLIVRSFLGDPDKFFDLVDGNPADTAVGLRSGKVVLGSVLSERLGIGVGDQIPLETADGTVQLDVVATANDYLAGGLTIYMIRDEASKLLGVSGVDAYVVQAEPGKLAEVEKALREYCQAHGLLLQSYADLVQYIDTMINGVIASLWMLLGLGCVIATMGLVNTLTMNILEQTREIGMLRTVAMTRGQVRRMIFAQATLLGVIGLIPGAAAGVLVSWAIGLSSQAVLGHEVTYQFRPGLVLGCLLVGLLVVMLSSLIPAERAARLKLASALHYE
ncbi:MAG: ABC transporter permease [Pirellulaceae bacterium]|nr:ABC transporter permease [Pirellulaceae bacterium]